jgi:DNA-binding response OmpR family regulator
MKILVVDDEKEIRVMVSKLLKRNGYEVVDVGSIDEAAKLIRNNAWDVIISDVMIPYSGGFELVDAVKSESATPVIIMTGMSEEVLRSTVTKADIILHKPFKSTELLNAVRTLTGAKILK